MKHLRIFGICVCTTIIFALPLGPFLRAQTAKAPAEGNGDLRIFFEGVKLSYESDHLDAQDRFEKYRDAHPDDLLVYLRILYDRLVANKESKLPPKEYDQLFALGSEAIAKYERRQCQDTDLVGIAGNTLDCPYVEAALYSFRMGIQAQRGFWRKAGKDKARFLAAEKASHSPQALFLLGLYEYKLSEQEGLSKAFIILARLPSDHDHAVATILKSAEGNNSPFKDDIWLFMFKEECRCGDKPSKDGEGFAKVHPLREVVSHLLSNCPNNAELQKFLASKGGKF